MRTTGGNLFYLPKGSTYYVKNVVGGGCYAINFEADIQYAPFCIKPKNFKALENTFKTACDDWRTGDPARISSAMKALYECIYTLQKKQSTEYMPNEKIRLITPAVNAIERNFTSPSLTISALAELCSVSEVYFRKIFLHSLGISPKEYLIRKRMEYAKQLIELGEHEIAEVAEMCGYSDYKHFSVEFKKHFGLSPTKYYYPPQKR
jgi:AraC-like DNA-binding protein